jgi:nanoRNase/pAp phosphatase (c-di-AMP/oligoRNAs hydrolase)
MARPSASSGTNGKEPPQRTSDLFLEGLRQASAVTFVSHVHPDPDSLGSMMGLSHLVNTRLGKPTRMIRDGVIGRAENRAMVELLDLELCSTKLLHDADPLEAVVMVDSQPNTGRHNFPCQVRLYGVIDHHDTPGDLTGIPFTDVRNTVGATCSVVTSYLMEQEVPIPPRIATGLLYGIETEVAGFPREAGELDEIALAHLYPLADKDLLARIRHARLPQSYFGCLVQALQSSFIYDRLIISWINELPQPELAAEVADFLMRFEEVEWALAAGVFEDKLILSLRSSAPDAQAGDVLRTVVNGMGKAGGHDRRAGGTIYLSSGAQSHLDDVRSDLRRKLLRALKIEECRGQRLVSRKEMLQNLTG